MNWKEAIDKFEERRLAIWEKMPKDVYNMSQGIVPGDTNVYGQYVTTMLYADSEMRTLGDEILFYLVETAKEEETQLYTLVRYAKNLLDYSQFGKEGYTKSICYHRQNSSISFNSIPNVWSKPFGN